MNHSQFAIALEVARKTKRPLFVAGAPGIGKTQGVYGFGAHVGAKVVAESAVCYDVTDFKGLPGIDRERGTAKWFPPDLFAQLDSAGPSILFWDDLTTAPPLVQAGLYRCMLERKIGDRALPDSCYVCGAGNRAIDAAAVNQMPTPLRSRMIHVTLEVNPEDWQKWALDNNITTEVLAFIRFRPGLLHDFDKKAYAFPCPRTWEYCSDVIRANPPVEVEHELIAGCVGDGAATEFSGFLRLYRKLPSIDAILLGPRTAPVPNEPAVLYALATALGRKATKDNLEAVCAYTDRLPSEFSVLCMKDAVALNSKIANCRAFLNWASNHAEVML